jgi:hemolysin activation/secretion protein
VRLLGDYLRRGVDQVVAVSATLTHGLDGTGAGAGLTPPKQGFNALLVQVNYARRLSADGLEFRARLSGQLTDSTLYSGERFSAGGETTVRGYRENLVLADEGVIASVELGRPLRLTRAPNGGAAFDWGAFAVTGFIDAAALRNSEDPQPERKLASLGAALAWTPSDAFAAQLTYGYALTRPPATGARNIQDEGLSFRVTVHPLRWWR